MPSTSTKQKSFMAAVAKNPAFAKKVGVPKAVGEDFTTADKGIKLSGGQQARADLQRVNKPESLQGKSELFKKGGSMATKRNPGFMAMMAKKNAGAKTEVLAKKAAEAKKMAAGGHARTADGVATKGKTQGTQIKMARGGAARSR